MAVPSSNPAVSGGDFRLPTLDGWRGVAIAGVLLSHTHIEGLSQGHVGLLFSYGRLGVDLFFAISGYLICVLLLRERDKTGGISLPSFFARRFFRILPLSHLYLLVLGLLGLLAGLPVSSSELALSAVFLRNLQPLPWGSYTNHLWSLAVEFHFYLLFPLWVRVARTRAQLGWILLAIGLAVEGWRRTGGSTSFMLLFRSDFRVDSLVWAALAAVWMQGRRPASFPGWLPWLVIGLEVALETFAIPMKPLLRGWLFALLVASTLHSSPGVLHAFLESAPLRWLGSRSYSLYIWQTLWLQHSVQPDPAWIGPWKRFPVSWVACLAFAELSHRFVEKPAIEWGRRWIRDRIRPQEPVPGDGSMGR